ncbi:hypothetical protein KKF84_01615 [Myxococcota bacterium]|nr:hypothetical protein [Myxococcota bacterium]
MRPHFLFILTTIVLLIFTSCAGGDSGNNSNTNNMNVDQMLADLELDMKEITCHHFVECRDQDTPYMESEAQCRDVFGVLADLLLLNEIKYVLQSDGASINQQYYNSCLYYLPQMECGEYYDNFAECRQILSGGMAEGEYCVSHFECQSGYCNSLETCPNTGVCTATAATAAPCSENAGCDFGLVCNRFSNTCGTTQANPLGGACAEDEDCDFGLSCAIPTGLTEGTCRAWLTPGAPCNNSDPTLAKCAPGTGCDPVISQCRIVSIVSTDESCDTVNVCDVAQREFCIPFVNTCTRMPIEGADCLQLGMEKFCWLGHYCGDDDLCHRQKSIGDSCEINEECSSLACGVRGSCVFDPCVDPLATFEM